MNTTSPELKDALREIINIGVGKAAGMLNGLLNNHITLDVPRVDIIPFRDIDRELGVVRSTSVSAVRLRFRGPITGVSSLVFPPDSAAKLVDVLVGEESFSDDLDAIKIGTLSEVGNIILNAVMAAFGNILETRLTYSIPSYVEGSVSSVLHMDLEEDAPVLSATTRFIVESDRIEGEIILLFEIGSFDILKRAINAAMEPVLKL
ncbi:chemotaxis protein CheX [Geobacter sp. SVR]|uniref:chemotaxis protein CheX n=1 Tax=Geobacter sp. SVR TaxID=2495594 RepID=UPI00143F02DB|nr:chemotaxis protein CheX [Geobacter sp. SVR]BCS52392.1 chemotaxis protein CheC [Geobacter sp. SVR]GCF87375.1 CheY-P-specific phosphatase CheC [Geobacter sp. SVR]